MAGKAKAQQPPDALAAAMASEHDIAQRAADIRGDNTKLTPELFNALWPLLCEPIPQAYIVTTPAVKGKPYVSTGIKSVQVQVDRMNNILTPLWWWDVADYQEDGKLCFVTVSVGNRPGGHVLPEILAERSSAGGVNQGSTIGNIYKGSYTNAAKRAIAMLGPGHEIYLGTSDLDPEVDTDLAGDDADQGKPLTKQLAKALVDRAWQLKIKPDTLRLAAATTSQRDVGDCSTKAKATDALATLTYEQGEKVSEWLTRKADEAKAPEGQGTLT